MEIVKSIQATLQERVVSPLSGVFVMSWAAMHYELVMMMMSDLNMIAKVALVNQHLVTNAKEGWGESWAWFAPYFYAICLPLAIGFIALVGYSVFSVLAFRISIWTKVELRNIKKMKEGEVLVTRLEYNQAIDAFQEKNNSFREREVKLEADSDRFKSLYQEELARGVKLQVDVDDWKAKALLLEQNISDIEGEKQVIAAPNVEIMPKAADEATKNHQKELEGGYIGLLLDGEDAKINRLALKLAKEISDDTHSLSMGSNDFLLRLAKPATEQNINMTNSILENLVLYHLLNKNGSGYDITLRGMDLLRDLKGGEDKVRGKLLALDGIVSS